MATEANIIDSLIISIGIDSSGVAEGRKKALADLKGLRDDATKNAGDVEKRNKRLAESVGSVKNEVLGLTLAFAGAASIKDFVGSILTSNASLGRMSANLGVNSRELSAWQYTVKAVGGSADDANASIQAMFGVMEAAKLGQATPAGQALLRLGVSGDDAAKGPDAMIAALAENRTNLSNPDRFALMQQAGLNPSSISALTSPDFQKNMAVGRSLAPRPEDIKAAQDLQKAWAQLAQTITHDATPAITTLVNGVNVLAKNSDNLTIAADGAIGVLTAVGVAAAIAAWPFALLAAGIAGALVAYQKWDTIKKDVAAIPHDIRKAVGIDDSSWYNPGGGRPPGGASGGAPATGNMGRIEGYLSAHGLSAGQTKGVAAGIFAESGGNPEAFNGTGGGQGAYGIGQWRGVRLKNLFAMFGNHPTLEQQLQFMSWEMKHGYSNAARNIGATNDPRLASQAFIYDYEAPGAGAFGDLKRANGYIYGGARAKIAHHQASSHHETTINGGIHVNAPNAKDGPGIAKTLPPAIKRRGLTAQANKGLTG